MSWNIGDYRNLFLNLKSTLRLHPIVLTTPKTSPENFNLTVLEMQQLSDVELTESTKNFLALNRQKIW